MTNIHPEQSLYNIYNSYVFVLKLCCWKAKPKTLNPWYQWCKGCHAPTLAPPCVRGYLDASRRKCICIYGWLSNLWSLFGYLNIRCRIIKGIRKGAIILTPPPHIHDCHVLGTVYSCARPCASLRAHRFFL